jgi:hypothetical protein
MPPDECGEKIIRWWGEVLRSSHHVRFLAGKLNPSDGLSRNPADREEFLGRRALLLKDPDTLERVFSRGEYEVELLEGAVWPMSAFTDATWNGKLWKNHTGKSVMIKKWRGLSSPD